MKGPIYIADIFLCRLPKKTTKYDDTFLQLMLRYTRHISTKCLHSADVYHTAILVNFSDIADIFLCRLPKKTTKCDGTFLQLMLRYTRHIPTKCLHKDTGYPGEILQLLQLCREYSLSEFLKTGILS